MLSRTLALPARLAAPAHPGAPPGAAARATAARVGAAVAAVGALALLVEQLDAPLALAGVALAALGAALVARPDLATLLVVFLLYTNAPVLASKQGVPVTLASAFLLLLGIPCLHYAVLRREGVRVDLVLTLMLVFLGVLLVSSLGARGADRADAYVWTYVGEGLALYALFVNAVRRRATLVRVVWTLLAAGALLGGLTVAQEVTGDYDQQFGGLAQRNAEYRQLLQLDPDDPETQEIVEEFAGGRTQRAEGPVNETNRFAQILLVLVPFAGFAYRTARGRWARLAALGAGALVAGGLLFAASRGAFVVLVLLALAAAAVRWVRPAHLAAGALAAALAVPAVAPQYAERVLSIGAVAAIEGQGGEADGAIRGRLTEMLAAAQAFVDHPLLGVGPGQYAPFYAVEYQQRDPRLKFRDLQTPRRAHSLYLEMAAELGLPGLATFLAVFAVLLRRLRAARRRWAGVRPDLADLATACTLSLVALLGTSAFLHLSYQRYTWLLVAVAGAALHVCRDAERAGWAAPGGAA